MASRRLEVPGGWPGGSENKIVLRVRNTEGMNSLLENYETKKPKSTLLANKTRGLITTKQTKPRPVAKGVREDVSVLLLQRLEKELIEV